MNNYLLLNSSITDSIEDIKKKYYQLMKIHHPDKSKTDGVKFKEINNAYNWIKENHNKDNIRENIVTNNNFNSFEDQGYSKIPSMTEYVNTEIMKINSKKLENESYFLFNIINFFLL